MPRAHWENDCKYPWLEKARTKRFPFPQIAPRFYLHLLPIV
jgi:hypothetical protein